MGKCYDAMNNYSNAVEQYQKALKISPNNYEAKYNLARAYAQSGNHNTAVKYYKEAGEKHGYNSKLLVQLGNAYLEMKNYKQATQTYKQAISKNSREVEAYKGLAKSMIAQNDITSAIVYLKEGANLTNDASIYAKLGELYFKIRDYDQAITAFRKALDRSEKNTLYRRLMADVYFAKKDFKKAAEEYEKVIALNPKVWIAYHRLGDSYIEMKMYEAAKVIYKKLIDRNPNYRKIGIIRQKLNELQGGS
jgi:tetratricopeptide (TPR) repeat protein